MAATTYAKEVKKRLIDMDKTQVWLCEEVAKRTGKYFDDSYLSKILRGKAKATKARQAINDILELSDAV